jgi:hypothetical protein
MRETLSEGGLESFDDSSVAVTSTSKLALLDAEEGAWEEKEEEKE